MSSQNKFPNIPNVDIGLHVVLHENIDQTLNGYALYTMLQ